MIICFGLPVYWFILVFWGQQNSPSPAFQSSTLTVIYLCMILLCMFLLIHLASKYASKLLKLTHSAKGATFWLGPGSPLCAVQAIVSFLERRGNRPDPLFLFENSLPLSCSLLKDRLRAILLSAALPGDFSRHSCQIGAATSAARAGILDHLIQVLGHWKSDAYKQNIRTPPDLLTRAAKSKVD